MFYNRLINTIQYFLFTNSCIDVVIVAMSKMAALQRMGQRASQADQIIAYLHTQIAHLKSSAGNTCTEGDSISK